MIAVDTNVLVYAHEPTSRFHRDALATLQHLVEHDRWGLPVSCIAEFVSVVTSPRGLKRPSPLQDALAFLGDWISMTSCQVLLPREDFLHQLGGIMRAANVTGRSAFDAQIAAICRQHGVSRIATYDRGFQRFAGIEVQNPTLDRFD